MIRKRLDRRGPGGSPRLTVTVVGEADVYRLARFLEMQGVRNGTFIRWHKLGLAILHALDRYRPGAVAEYTRELGPQRVTYRGRRRPSVQLRLCMPADELRQLEEAIR